MTLTYADLLEKRDPTKSYLGFNSAPYKDNDRLLKLYEKGYFNGLDCAPIRGISFEDLTPDEQAAYIHGFFSGDYEAHECDD